MKYIYKRYRKQYSSWSSEKVNYGRGRWRSGRNLPKYYGYYLPPSWNGEEYIDRGEFGRWETAYLSYKEELRVGYTEEYYSYIGSDGTYHEWFYYKDEYYRTRTVSKGEFVDEIIAEDGTYPDDGYLEGEDEYYYVKDRLAFPEMWVKVNGNWKQGEQGWVKINGVWKEIDSMFVKVNNSWKQTI